MYPIPQMNEPLERLDNTEYISTLDLTKGYWQIPLMAESWEKMIFPNLFGLYLYPPFSD